MTTRFSTRLSTATALGLAIALLSSTAQAQIGLGDILGNGQLRDALQGISQAAMQTPGSVFRPEYSTHQHYHHPQQPTYYTQPQPVQPSYPMHTVVQQPVVQQPVVTHTVVSQPVPSAAVAPARTVQPAAMNEMQKARALVAEAKRMFTGGDYSNAVPKLEELVKLAAKDANAYQFRSFVNFANEDYDAAAADAYDALLIGNTWNWQTVYDLYKDVDTYQQQLRKLELKTQSDPSMSTHFLLGYQYLVLGHLDRGQKELKKVLVIAPEEELVTKLVAVLDRLKAQQSQAMEPAANSPK
ncbi:MAG: hypothetical protein R3C53_07195 [Pirellulaceae bacterium]